MSGIFYGLMIASTVAAFGQNRLSEWNIDAELSHAGTSSSSGYCTEKATFTAIGTISLFNAFSGGMSGDVGPKQFPGK